MTAPWASLACTSWLNVLGGQRRHRRGTVEPLHPALSPSPSRFLPPFLLPDLSTHKVLFRKVALPPEATPRPCETVASPRGGWSLRCCGREGDPHAGTSLESPALCTRGCPAHHSGSALCPGSLPTPLSSGRQAEGPRRVLQPALALRERASCVRPTTRPPMVAQPCAGAAGVRRILPLSVSPLPGRRASLGCEVRTQHSARGAPRTPRAQKPSENTNSHLVLGPSLSFSSWCCFLLDLLPSPASTPASSPSLVATPECILSWATA